MRTTTRLAAAALAALACLMVAPAVRVAADPSPPFAQCPAVSQSASCRILIVIEPDGSLSFLFDSTQRPFDGGDDTLVGVQNDSAVPVPSISIGSATLPIFGFEGDGICHYAFVGDGYCTAPPLPATGYEGPTTAFSDISANKKRGTVDFTDPGGLAAGAATFFSLEDAITGTTLTAGAPSSLVFTPASATSGDSADSVVVGATLTSGGVPTANAAVTFTLGPGAGAVSCTATTDSAGVASCALTPGQAAGTYPLIATYAGSSVPFLGPVDTTESFVVTHEQVALVYTGATSGAAGQPLLLSAAMTTDDPSAATPLSGRPVRFTVGAGVTAQSCTAQTDATGRASCTVVLSTLWSGPVAVTAAFAGDGTYRQAASSATVEVVGMVVPTPAVGAATGLPTVPALVLVLAGACAALAGRRRRR